MNRQLRNRLSVSVCVMIAGLASTGAIAEKVWSDDYKEYIYKTPEPTPAGEGAVDQEK